MFSVMFLETRMYFGFLGIYILTYNNMDEHFVKNAM